ncbi:hypothetical protein, partial [Neisseria gonorrhoeae]|uniref:hypothetical protein n=4 Tax=Neisseria gonorrhoeae TaxID=485 RepID=UPI001E435F9D
LGWVGLGWVGLGWVGLGWVGLGWQHFKILGLNLSISTVCFKIFFYFKRRFLGNGRRRLNVCLRVTARQQRGGF